MKACTHTTTFVATPSTTVQQLGVYTVLDCLGTGEQSTLDSHNNIYVEEEREEMRLPLIVLVEGTITDLTKKERGEIMREG